MGFWDEQFAEEGYKYGEEPNAYLMEQAWRFRAGGDVLVPGDGEGRNGVWLASQGHRVVSVDGSRVGLEKARALAKRRGVKLETVRADLMEWSPAEESADAVVLTYVHLPAALREVVHGKLARALRPGGWLVLEAFHPRQLEYGSFGPKSEELLYTLDQMRKDFGGVLVEAESFEGEVTLKEGRGHEGPGYVIRWVGQRAENRGTAKQQ